MSNDIKNFSEMLRANSVSVTTPRIEIFETLSKAEKPLKNGEIARRTSNVDRTSVYRSLELFSKLGITVTTIRGWTPMTELAEPFRGHHHHMNCEKCGNVVEIEDDVLEDVLGTIATKYGFEPHQHVVEVTGLCKKCQKSRS